MGRQLRKRSEVAGQGVAPAGEDEFGEAPAAQAPAAAAPPAGAPAGMAACPRCAMSMPAAMTRCPKCDAQMPGAPAAPPAGSFLDDEFGEAPAAPAQDHRLHVLSMAPQAKQAAASEDEFGAAPPPGAGDIPSKAWADEPVRQPPARPNLGEQASLDQAAYAASKELPIRVGAAPTGAAAPWPADAADVGEEVTVTWGEETIQLAPFCTFHVGPFSATTRIRPGESRAAAIVRAHAQLIEFAEQERRRKAISCAAEIKASRGLV